jgi:hypothetical protein
VSTSDFDLTALWEALDLQRRMLALSWAEVASSINGSGFGGTLLSPATLAGLKDKDVAEGDGVLQMLIWLERTPESFVPGFEEADEEAYKLPLPGTHEIVRFDSASIFRAVNAVRTARALSWTEAAHEIGGFTGGMLSRMAAGGRVAFPGVVRIARWVNMPVASFTKVVSRR